MALKSDMPEESRNSKVIEKKDFTIILPDPPKSSPSKKPDTNESK
ncbi:hypothetical protein [Listeria costaricensis]|nr:hypothetical protein [Listeria costaricensis]